MGKKTSNWTKNPTKTQVILFTLLSIFGIALLILVATDLLTENPFRKKYVMLFLFGIGSATATLKLNLKYWKNLKTDSK